MRREQNMKTKEGRHAFYKSGEWRAMRLYILNRDKLCVTCLGENRLTYASVVDHVEDLIVSPHLSLEPSNLQGLCPSCHNKKTAKTRNGAYTKFKPKNLMWDINEMLDI